MLKSDYAQQQFFHLVPPLFATDDELSEDDLLGDEELLNESHLTVSTVQSDEDEGADALLDESSLETILDMLAVITSIEELMLLETLTAAQKRQVWSATPEVIKNKLKQIREAGFSTAEASPPETWQNLDPQNLEPNQSNSNQPVLAVGNQVVLLAKAQLTAAELIAIWDVIEVHEGYARIRAKNLVRTYPIDWMVAYAKPSSD